MPWTAIPRIGEEAEDAGDNVHGLVEGVREEKEDSAEAGVEEQHIARESSRTWEDELALARDRCGGWSERGFAEGRSKHKQVSSDTRDLHAGAEWDGHGSVHVEAKCASSPDTSSENHGEAPVSVVSEGCGRDEGEERSRSMCEHVVPGARCKRARDDEDNGMQSWAGS